MKKGISFLRNIVRLLVGILAVLGWLVLSTSSPLMALVLVALLCSCLAVRKSSWERLNITMDDLLDENVDLRSRLTKGIKPFGQNLVVVIRKGGAMDILKARQLSRESFLCDAVFNDATNLHATILKAKGMP